MERKSASNHFEYDAVLPSKPSQHETSDGSMLSRLFKKKKKRERTLSNHDVTRSETDALRRLQNSQMQLKQNEPQLNAPSESLSEASQSMDSSSIDPNEPILKKQIKSLSYEEMDTFGVCSPEQFMESVKETRQMIQAGRYIYENMNNEIGGNNFIILLEATADIMKSIGNNEEAIELLLEAVKVCRKYILMSSQSKLKLASLLNDLGLVYGEANKFNEAQNAFSEGFELLRDVYGDVHPDVAACLGNTGISYRGSKEYSMALSMHEKAIKMMERLCGKDHEYTMHQQLLLGITLIAAGDNQQGSRILRLLQNQVSQTNPLPDNHPWNKLLNFEYNKAMTSLGAVEV
jgi:tetratricopeptide (TPR) repeat protein